MANLYCDNCGAEVEEAAKFCRRCGQPQDWSEATTRTLEEPSRREAPTRHVNPAPTAPSYPVYAPPPGLPVDPAATTRGLEGSGQKRTVIFLASLVGILLIGFIALLAITFSASNGPPPMPPPPMTAPQRPPIIVPETPAVPEPPEPPEPPDAEDEPDAEDAEGEAPEAITIPKSSLTYPGSEVILDMTTSKGTGMLQLKTKDAFDKVVGWYTSKFDMTQKIQLPGSVILEGEKVTAIIASGDNGTLITLTPRAER